MKRSEMIEYMIRIHSVSAANIKYDLAMHMDLMLKCLETQGMLPPETIIKEKGFLGRTKIKKIRKWDKE